ncbi:Dual specificity protein kinase KNS1 [Nakaseomyces glabratus]|nr:Dual specificity protein kinase KNS1 [Nakaseomyces glabratus]KTB17638.1 Dual specificity protein kinase KNS1 [Nakaseomyces glabratus]KTB27232.1 Dual specificity protein kinase KNS1 [Nakaseomyces glabratus]
MLGFKRKRTNTNNNNNNTMNFAPDLLDDLMLDDRYLDENAILDDYDTAEAALDPVRYKKQRTVSLPQLPHSRLSYSYFVNTLDGSNSAAMTHATANLSSANMGTANMGTANQGLPHQALGSAYTHHRYPADDNDMSSLLDASLYMGQNAHAAQAQPALKSGNWVTPPARIQNDDELLHLTGSSSKTLEGNRSVQLKVAHSVSPFTNENSTGAASGISAGFKNSFKRLLSHEQQPYDDNIPRRSSIASRRRSSVKRVQDAQGSLPNMNYFQTDKDGHYIYQENDVFGSNGQFVVKELLGQGTFGKVLKCVDTYSPNNKFVAVKVIRAVDRYREAAKTELRVLSTILENDPVGQFQCLLLRDCFDYKNHICLVTDLYGRSVYDFMCSNGVARFPGSHIQAMARQLIRSVCFLHDMGIIHTDLKPENILLVDESYVEYDLPQNVIDSMSNRRRAASQGKRKILTNPEIKIIDFGSAVFHKEYHPPVISTRHYRAPEIVLGLGWSFPCDVWSIACVLVELVIGESLYPIHENLEHMAMMQRINGTPFPTKLIDKMFYKVRHKLGNLPSDLNTTVVRHFNRQSLTLQWPEKNKRGEIVTTEKSMKRVMESCDRLDVYISRVLKQDYGERLSINWNLSPDKNWSLVSSKLLWRGHQHYDGNIYEGSHMFPPQHKLDKDSFLFWYWFVDLCRKMFEFDPTKRITARKALDHEWFNLGIFDEGITNFANPRAHYRNSI